MQYLNFPRGNPASDQPDKKLLGLPESKDESGLVQDMLFQTRTETARLRRRLERQETEYVSLGRQTRVLWAAILLIVAAFGVNVWFGLQENGSLETKIPSTGLEPARPPAKELAMKSTPPIEPAADGIVSSSSESAPKAASPESSSSATTLRLADSVTRVRTDFVLPLNKTWEVVPGIFLTVREASLKSQRIDGWLQIAEDGRTVPIRSQGLQDPATFTTRRDLRKRAVVFTRIDKWQVAGYLLIPLPAG